MEWAGENWSSIRKRSSMWISGIDLALKDPHKSKCLANLNAGSFKVAQLTDDGDSPKEETLASSLIVSDSVGVPWLLSSGQLTLTAPFQTRIYETGTDISTFESNGAGQASTNS